jgi:hypothetical protein
MINSRRMRLAEHVARIGERGMRIGYRILVGKPEGKRQLVRPRHRWMDNIKMNLRQVGMVWTGFIWFRIGTSGGLVVNTVLNLRVPKYSEKFLSACTIGGLSRRAQFRE